jgi:hypothetical protein
VDLLARDPHPLRDDVGEELARAADERDAGAVLVGARSLADEHDPARALPVHEDRLRARLRELAGFAARHGAREAREIAARRGLLADVGGGARRSAGSGPGRRTRFRVARVSGALGSGARVSRRPAQAPRRASPRSPRESARSSSRSGFTRSRIPFAQS